MTNLDKYIKENNLSNHKEKENMELLYNAAIPVRKRIISNGRIEGFEHSNTSVMFLVCASIEDYDAVKNNYKLNENIFSYQFVALTLALMLESEPNANPHPFDSGIWG